MQLDKTRIAVRERGMLDILDLALLVFRIHFLPICFTLCLGALPWAVANYLLVTWMLPADIELVESPAPFLRYAWTMTLLVVLQAPLASSFTTVYLGKALFMDHPSLRETVREVVALGGQLLWFHLVLRGVLPAICLVLAIDRSESFAGMETLLILLFVAVMLRRCVAPFLNEIMLLERIPLQARNTNTITMQRRSVALHSRAAGTIITLALVVTLYCMALAGGLTGVLYVGQGILLNQWELYWGIPVWGWPLALWLTVAFATVVRYLSYLDIRIRQEGWEVELRMRAEGARIVEALR